MLADRISTIAQVTRITETVFGIFVDYSFISKNGEAVKGSIKELDVSRYGLTSVIPQTVEITYLPSDLEFVWLGHMEGKLETFWADFLRSAGWISYLIMPFGCLLRLMISNIRRELDGELQNY